MSGPCPMFAAAILLAAAPAHSTASADSAGATAEVAVEAPRTAEEECFALFESLGTMLEQREAVGEIEALEAEEIAVIAEELLAEGDFEIARTLVEEAIALLSPRAAE